MDFDRVCESRTAMSVRCLPMVDHRGADVVVTVAKMAYRVSPRGVVALADLTADLHHRRSHRSLGARQALHQGRVLGGRRGSSPARRVIELDTLSSLSVVA